MWFSEDTNCFITLKYEVRKHTNSVTIWTWNTLIIYLFTYLIILSLLNLELFLRNIFSTISFFGDLCLTLFNLHSFLLFFLLLHLSLRHSILFTRTISSFLLLESSSLSSWNLLHQLSFIISLNLIFLRIRLNKIIIVIIFLFFADGFLASFALSIFPLLLAFIKLKLVLQILIIQYFFKLLLLL